MTKVTIRNESRHVWMAVIFSSLLLTCCSSPSNKEPVAAKAEPQSKTEPQSTPTPKLAEEDLFHELAELAASGEIYKFTPDIARQRLNKFARLEDHTSEDLKRDAPGTLVLLGANPTSGMWMIHLEFYQPKQGKDKGRTYFSVAEFDLSRKEGDSDQIFNDFKPVLAAQMAKHGIVKSEPIDGGVKWKLVGDKIVTLQKDDRSNLTDQQQRVVVLGITVEDNQN